MAAARELPIPPDITPEQTLSAPQWGMLAFLLSEVAFFATLVVTYVTFMGHDKSGPGPREALSLPLVIVSTICLLSSSFTIHLAERAAAASRKSGFHFWWALTITLGIAFLAFTGYEWHELIFEQGLTISRNLFGTTYYTLVGFHALHVTMGVMTMLIVLALSLRGRLSTGSQTAEQLSAWYWHFVDGVWIVVFLVVYVGGKLGAA
jgi:cytochrome c oxidase subunit 3/cytochrome o ubiquinol oxidase subunit 3